jgi:hypothetical protein
MQFGGIPTYPGAGMFHGNQQTVYILRRGPRPVAAEVKKEGEGEDSGGR